MFVHQSIAPEDKELRMVQDSAISMAQKAFRSLQNCPSKQYPAFSWSESPLKLIDKNFEVLSQRPDYPYKLYCRELAIFFGIAFRTEFLGISHNFEGPLNLYYDTDEKVINYFFDNIIKKEYISACINGKVTDIKSVKVKYPVIDDGPQNFISKIKNIFAGKQVREDTLKEQRLVFFKDSIRSIIDKDLQEQKMNLAIQEAVFYKLEQHLETIKTFDELEHILTLYWLQPYHKFW